MDKMRVSKVDQVKLLQLGQQSEGSLHLSQYHIIFSAIVPAPANQPDAAPKKREKWFTYPLIAHCTYKPAQPVSHQPHSIRIQFRDFTFVALQFLNEKEKEARSVYDQIRQLTCRIGRVEKLYAYNYHPTGPEKELDGWKVYDARKEFARLGITKTRDDSKDGWRFTGINVKHEYSDTYPATLVVPSAISDMVLRYGGPHRSRCRIPALTYLHPINQCSITRSSQPKAGVRQTRSQQDEALVNAIFNSSIKSFSRSGVTSPPPSQTPKQPSPEQSATNLTTLTTESPPSDGEALEEISLGQDADGRRVYGAQQSNIIVDARPQINAMVNHAAGMGSENMDHYKGAQKWYLGIENIHVMRKSLDRVVDALSIGDFSSLPPNQDLLAQSGWLKHIGLVLDGSKRIAQQVGLQHSHVLIHCSDGWDRTSQLSALSQLMLDPYYRTFDGFITLIEKDWLSFGHRFRYRSGLLGSDKWFKIEGDRAAGKRAVSDAGENGLNEEGGALNNAWLKARDFFKKGNDSQESLADSDGEVQALESSPGTVRRSAAKAKVPVEDAKNVTKTDEVSPIFHQFLDATYQLLYQYPSRFEFNQRFLKRLLYHLYSCQYGTFLFDNEKQRIDAQISEKTRSVWDYFLCRRADFINPKYESDIDDAIRGKERLLFPDIAKVRWWSEGFGRKDEEMNTPVSSFVAGLQQALPKANGFSPASTSRMHSRSPSGQDTYPVGNGTHQSAVVAVEDAEGARGEPRAIADLAAREAPVQQSALAAHGQAANGTRSPSRDSSEPGSTQAQIDEDVTQPSPAGLEEIGNPPRPAGVTDTGKDNAAVDELEHSNTADGRNLPPPAAESDTSKSPSVKSAAPPSKEFTFDPDDPLGAGMMDSR